MSAVKWIIVLAGLLCLAFSPLHADECFEGDCENGWGKGFTEEGLVYEGEWRDGEPHGQGKLVINRDRILEGEFNRGAYVGGED